MTAAAFWRHTHTQAAMPLYKTFQLNWVRDFCREHAPRLWAKHEKRILAHAKVVQNWERATGRNQDVNVAFESASALQRAEKWYASEEAEQILMRYAAFERDKQRRALMQRMLRKMHHRA